MQAPRNELEICREWARERLKTGAEPPWSYYRLMQLVEVTTLLLSGAAVISIGPDEENNVVSIHTRSANDEDVTLPV